MNFSISEISKLKFLLFVQLLQVWENILNAVHN